MERVRLSPRVARLVRLGPWIFWPMLIGSLGLLVWRVAVGDGAGRITWQVLQVVTWVCLLINNRLVWRGHQAAVRGESTR